MSGEETTKAKADCKWIIHTPLGFYRGYDLSIRSVTFTQDAALAQDWGLKWHAEQYIAATTLAGIPTTVIPRLGAQDRQEMDTPTKATRAAITGLEHRIGG